jgi:hypothetical protein
MSYDLTIYHRDVRAAVEGGADLEDVSRPAFTREQRDAFERRLLANGYVLEFTSAEHSEYMKTFAGCPVQVAMFECEIGIGIPYWDNVEVAIRAAIKDMTALGDETMAMFDPQEGAWLDSRAT